MREREGKRGSGAARGGAGGKLVCFAATIYVSASAKGGEGGTANGEEDGEEAKARKPEFRLLHYKVWVWVD